MPIEITDRGRCRYCGFVIYQEMGQQAWFLLDDTRVEAWEKYGWFKDWGTYATFCPALFSPAIEASKLGFHEPQDPLLEAAQAALRR